MISWWSLQITWYILSAVVAGSLAGFFAAVVPAVVAVAAGAQIRLDVSADRGKYGCNLKCFAVLATYDSLTYSCVDGVAILPFCWKTKPSSQCEMLV